MSVQLANTRQPALLPIGDGLFAMMQDVQYTARNGDVIRIPLRIIGGHVYGFTTDGGSKPWLTQWLVGGSFDEGKLGYYLHDWLYRARYVERAGQIVQIGQRYADDLLDEVLEFLGMDPLKRTLIVEGVRMGGHWHFANGPAMNWETPAFYPADPFGDWALLPVWAVPSFNPEVDDLIRQRVGV